ncbi:MAG: hypothetical protein QXZ66_05945 [Thermoproteota archaeon]
MNRKVRIEPRKTVEIDIVGEDLFIGRNSTVIVKGDVEFEGDCNILSSLHAYSLRLENGGRINVQGDLIVEKTVELENGELLVSGRLEAEEVDVGKVVRVGKGLKFLKISVGGVLESGGDVDSEKNRCRGESFCSGKREGK